MRSGGSQGNYRLPALPPTKAEASRPRYTIHVDPDMVQYWDDEDEDEFPLKDDPFFMCYEGEQQEEMGTGHYLATLLLFAIPVVGLIMMIYWSLCGSKWEERQAGHCLHDQAAGGGPGHSGPADCGAQCDRWPFLHAHPAWRHGLLKGGKHSESKRDYPQSEWCWLAAGFHRIHLGAD
jgi:hypothetical protein